ncbi:unnamed protein product [Closterium sp. Naga37s-1]|nr:unnamed protein product [Closterium sp. Naga37s-1]
MRARMGQARGSRGAGGHKGESSRLAEKEEGEMSGMCGAEGKGIGGMRGDAWGGVSAVDCHLLFPPVPRSRHASASRTHGAATHSCHLTLHSRTHPANPRTTHALAATRDLRRTTAGQAGGERHDTRAGEARRGGWGERGAHGRVEWVRCARAGARHLASLRSSVPRIRPRVAGAANGAGAGMRASRAPRQARSCRFSGAHAAAGAAGGRAVRARRRGAQQPRAPRDVASAGRTRHEPSVATNAHPLHRDTAT